MRRLFSDTDQFSDTDLLWTVLCVIGVVCAVFGVTLFSQFVLFDDNILITGNPTIQGLTPHNILTAFRTFDPELYTPLTFLSYQLDYSIAGLASGMFHATNIVLHSANALLVIWLLFLLTGKRSAAIVGGLLFAVHPLNVETVAWASARKDLLSGFFVLLSMISYLRYKEEQNTRLYYVAVGAFACALLSKVSVVLLPLVLFLFDFLEHRRFDRQVILEKIPFFLLSGIFGLIALVGKQEATGLIDTTSLILLSAKSTAFYLQKFFWPTGLSVLYPFAGTVSLTHPDILLSWGVLSVLSLLALVSLRWTRVLFVAFAFSFLLLLPSFSNVMKGGVLYFASDRYAYIAGIGIILLIAVLWEMLWQRLSEQRHYLLVSITAILLVFLAGKAAVQAATWKSTETLFTQTMKFYPNALAAHINAAVSYRELGRYDKSQQELQRALLIKDHPIIHIALGALASSQGRTDEAIASMKDAFRMDPREADASFGTAVMLAKAGRTAEAEPYYRQTIFLVPRHTPARNNLASSYLDQGRTDEAIEQYKAIIAYDSDFYVAYYNLGLALEKQAKNAEALDAFEHAYALQTPSMNLLSHMGPLYVSLDQPTKAVKIFQQGIDRDAGNAEFLQEVLTGVRTILQKNPQQKETRALLEDLLRRGLVKST